MKTKWCVTGFLLIALCAGVQLYAQQTNVDRKLYEETKAKAENGDAESQFIVGAAFDFVVKDYVEAVKWYRKAGEQNHAQAQVLLGECFREGKGVNKDPVEAVKWYRKAADQGSRWGQYRLGLSYYQGEGVATNKAEAMKYVRKAADQGLDLAEYSMGAYYKEDGAAQDYAEATKWYRKAAEQGHDESQLLLGIFCYAGYGTPRDYVQAYKWYCLSAAQGNKEATKMLNLAEQSMTRDQIAEGQRLAREFKPQKVSDTKASSPTDIFVASGTGFFITEDGYLITNNHVVEGATKVRLITSAGLISAKVVKVDAANDLALLKAEGNFSPLPIASSRTMHLGNTVTTVGFPNIGLQGFAPKFARGEIAALSGASDDAKYFQISVPVQPGNSGGALADEHGNVVGVVSAKLSALAALNSSGALPENVNYAVKSSFLLSFLESVPEVSAKLKEPETKERKAEDVVKSAEQAAVLVVVY